MRGTSARSASTPSVAQTPAERLAALEALQAGARDRLDRSPGFLASLDDEVIAAHVASDLPEELGTWPDHKADTKPA